MLCKSFFEIDVNQLSHSLQQLNEKLVDIMLGRRVEVFLYKLKNGVDETHHWLHHCGNESKTRKASIISAGYLRASRENLGYF